MCVCVVVVELLLRFILEVGLYVMKWNVICKRVHVCVYVRVHACAHARADVRICVVLLSLLVRTGVHI